MRLLLLRHGAAESGWGIPDDQRRLTAAGKNELRHVLGCAKAAGVAPELILTSPIRRAVETCEIAAESLGYTGERINCAVLKPDADPKDLWEEIRLHGDVTELLLIGHQPLIGRATAYLLGAPELAIDITTSALVRLGIDKFGPQPRGTLSWMLTPEIAGL